MSRALPLVLVLAADPASASRPTILTHDLARAPDAAAVARVYPRQALAEAVEGRATIQCRVTADGRLDACVVTGEAPAGYGFGEAALALSVEFRMRPLSRDGSAAGGDVVRIPILFRLPVVPQAGN